MNCKGFTMLDKPIITFAKTTSPQEGCHPPTQGGQRLCRICLQEDDPIGMISPCRCRGSMQYVHTTCLNRWRASTSNPLTYYRCEHCLTFYRHSSQLPIMDVALMELLREHREWERLERQREIVLLGLALLVLLTLAMCTAHILLALHPSVSPIWLICVPLDLYGLIFLFLHVIFGRS